jgi:hypothetical protein
MNTFHVRHDFSPTVARDALLLLRLAGGATEHALLSFARERDLEIGHRKSATKVFASLRDLGLIERCGVAQRENLQLTHLGSQLAVVATRNELLFAELIHLRYWSLWKPESTDAKFAWAYQTVANILWQESPTAIESGRLVAAVLAAAEYQFGLKGISFSSSSILGILHWLRALSPSCVINSEFRRRPICPPEAFVLALEGIHAITQRPLGIPLRLDAATRERVCRAVLLDNSGFDEVLSLAEDSLGIVHRGGDGGEVVIIRESLFPGLVPSGSHS